MAWRQAHWNLKNEQGFHAKVDSLMKQAVADLKRQGAEVIELDYSMERGVNGASFTVMLYEFKDGLSKYFASLGDKHSG